MTSRLYVEAKTLVLKALQTEDGLILTGQTFGGWFIQTGNWNTGFVKGHDAARWKDALETLYLNQFIKLTGVHLYELTSYGRQLSNSLSAED